MEAELDDKACVRDALYATQISYIKHTCYMQQMYLPWKQGITSQLESSIQ